VVYHATDGSIVSANPAAGRILGLTQDQILGKTSMDPRWKMIREDGSEVTGMNHPAMIALRTGRKEGPVVRGVFHPGKNAHIWLSITAMPQFKPGESMPSQVYATFEDITEKRQVEQDFQALFREMFNGFALHEIICDEAGKPVDYRFLAVNPAFERMTGLKSEQVLGKTVLEIMPDTEKFWIDTYGGVALTGKAVRFEKYSPQVGKRFQITAFRPAHNQFACVFAEVLDGEECDRAPSAGKGS
jgi:two-component system CheB/CheR fusion protein